jgi:hypothetical protein
MVYDILNSVESIALSAVNPTKRKSVQENNSAFFGTIYDKVKQ